jgi:hypothetical protein
MRLQKAKKLTKNSSLLPQTPNRKQALNKKMSLQRVSTHCSHAIRLSIEWIKQAVFGIGKDG